MLLSVSVAPVPQFVDEPGVGGMPIELGASPGGVGALIEQEHLGEVVAQARPGLVVGAGARLVAGTGRVDRPVRVAQQAQDRRPVVQVDDGRRRAALTDDAALGIVATRAMTSWPCP